jgi:hypothetical protein
MARYARKSSDSQNPYQLVAVKTRSWRFTAAVSDYGSEEEVFESMGCPEEEVKDDSKPGNGEPDSAAAETARHGDEPVAAFDVETEKS